jgi:hypothetical protein
MSDEPEVQPNKKDDEPEAGAQSAAEEGDAAGNTYPPGVGPDPTLDRTALIEDANDEEEATPQSRARDGGDDGGGGDGYSTNDKTVDGVLADVDAGTVSAQEALDAERGGQNRTTLIAGLEQRGAS